jgi:cytoskeletal protein RodZ
MANDGFDDFGFDSNSGFGDDFDSGFSNDGGFGSNDSFGEDDIFGDDSSSTQSSGDVQQSQFGESLNNLNNQSQNAGNDNKKALTKQAIITIIVGVIGIILVLVIAGVIKSKKSNTDTSSLDQVQVTSTTNNQQSSDVNVDDVMSNSSSTDSQDTSSSTNNQTVVTNKVDDDFTWTLITDSENVTFNDEYSDMVFTITNIEHKARVVDTNNNLVVITTLQGSISGLSGTYEIDVPYNKGVKLVVGNNFTVHVQLGTYNGKTVVGEIQY